MVKKVRLSPAEKKKLKQEKKLAKKLAAEEKKRQQKRDFLTRELQYGRLNRKTLEKSWKKMLFDIKLPILQREFQVAMNHVEKILDWKDFQISFLMDELDEAQEQYYFNLRSHCENINNVIDLYHTRLDELKRDYDNELANILQDSKSQLNYLNSEQMKQIDYFGKMIHRLKIEDKNLDKKLRGEYLSKMNEDINKNNSDLQVMRENSEKLFAGIWSQFTDVLVNYKQNIEINQKEYERLNNRDNAVRKIIKSQTGQFINLHDTIRKLKDRQIAEKEILDKQEEFKMNEKTYLLYVFESLRQNLSIDWKCDADQLNFLVITSKDLIKNLENRTKNGEKIIKMYEMTRKYETKKEKILAFPQLQPESNTKIVETRLKDLGQFWLKCCQADSLRHFLYEERNFKYKENVFLKKQLFKYCSGTKYSCDFLLMMSKNVKC